MNGLQYVPSATAQIILCALCAMVTDYKRGRGTSELLRSDHQLKEYRILVKIPF